VSCPQIPEARWVKSSPKKKLEFPDRHCKFSTDKIFFFLNFCETRVSQPQISHFWAKISRQNKRGFLRHSLTAPNLDGETIAHIPSHRICHDATSRIRVHPQISPQSTYLRLAVTATVLVLFRSRNVSMIHPSAACMPCSLSVYLTAYRVDNVVPKTS